MSDTDRYIIGECRHCGNKTKLDIVAEHCTSEDVEYYDDLHNQDISEWVSDTDWHLLECCVCKNISIATRYTDRNLASRDVEYYSIIYPQLTYSSYQLPKEIYSAYEVALKAKYLDEAICLLSLRRTLEIICKEQGETSGNLYEKINKLVERGILPNVLKDASYVIRKLGNEAAHGDSKQFNSHDVKQLIELVELIIEYIYILPNKIERLKESLTN